MSRFDETWDGFLVASFLKEEGIPEEYADVFEANMIDGYEFTQLTIEDLLGMVKPVGIVKKIRRIVEKVTGVSDIMEAARIKAVENVSVPTGSGSSSSVSLDTSPSTSVGTIDFKVFPKSFPIPSKWSDSTSKAISSGRMTPHTRKEMIQTLVTLMMVYDQKPSRVRCEQVAIDLIRKYPQLADPLGKAHGSWTEKLVQRVTNKAKNMK